MIRVHSLLFAGILSFAISFSLYANTVQNEFVYDDYQFVDSPSLHRLDSIPKLLFLPGNPNAPISGYRPLTYVTMALQFSLVGDHPKSFHIVNILLNAAAIFLVFCITKKLFGNFRLAAFTCILFAFFPIHTENVASIKGRDDLLAAVLALCAWLILLHGKRWWSGLVFLFAVLSKELVLFAPILFFFVPAAIQHKQPGFWKRLFSTLPYLVSGILYIIFRFIAFGPFAFSGKAIAWVFNPMGFADPMTKFWTNWKITGMYLTKTFIPYNLSAGYQYNHLTLIDNPFDAWEVWVGMAAVLLLLLFFFHPKTRSAPLGVGAFVFGVFFIPLPKVLFQAADIFAERWMYMPSLGLAMIGGYLFDLLIQKQTTNNKQLFAWSLFAILLIVYTAVILPRNLTWHDNETFYSQMIADSPRNIFARYSLARQYYITGDLDQAERLAQSAYGIYDRYPELLYLLGQISYHRGDYPQAQSFFQKAAQEVGHATQLHGMYALLLAKQGQYQEAIDYINNNLDKLNERDSSILLILGGSYHQLGDLEKAKEYLGWDKVTQDYLHRKELDNFLAGGDQDFRESLQIDTNL